MYAVVKQAELSAVLPYKNVLEGILADFAFKRFPDVRVHNRRFFAVTFASKPILKAAQADVPHRAHAFARGD